MYTVYILLKSQGQLQNMLTESNLGLAAGVHVYYQHTNQSDPHSALEDPTPHIAAFMVMRQEFWCFLRTSNDAHVCGMAYDERFLSSLRFGVLFA